MGALIRSTDWSKTGLGPIEQWPQSLRTMLGVVLGSRFPMLLWWGPRLLHLYNDAYRPILRDKHPASLAAPAAEVWAEVWDVAGPMAKSVQEGGPATWTEDLQLFINSGGMAEETYFTFSYSPVPGDDGSVGGILNTVQETTAKVQSERQIKMLHDLSARAADAKSEDEAFRIALEVLATNELDLPFFLFYLVDGKTGLANLVGSRGWKDYEGIATPARVQLAGEAGAAPWPLAEVARTGQEVVIDDLSKRFGALPVGRWNASPERAMVLPLSRAAEPAPYGFLVAGISPHRPLDDRYRTFFQATADQVITILSNARAYEAVTEIKAAERSIRHANQFLEAVIENIPHMVFVKDAERLGFVRFNRAGEELLGVPRSALIGKNDYDFFPEEEAAFFQAKDRETLNGKSLIDIPEEPIQTPRGQRVLHTKKVPILDGSGTPLYLLGISEDITDRKAGDAARAWLAAIVDDSDDAIVGLALDGTITSWNQGAEAMFGFSAAEMVGSNVSVLFPRHRRDDEADFAERISGGERIAQYETVRKRKDGREIDVWTTLSPIRDPSGNLIGVSKIARDVTQLKRMQRDLLRAKEDAEASNRELESFSYSVAHDLRAPLRSIDGFSQALLEDCGDQLDASGRKYLGFVRQSAQLMAQLIDDMLTLSRVTRSELVRQKVDVSALAHASLLRLERSQPDRALEVVIQEGLEAHGDPRLLAVVLDNLLGNAWKFTSKREGALVEFGSTSENGRAVYFVRDNGAGFDMTYARKLFGVFQRLHAAHDFEGTGVGLATVQRIIQRHGGRVWAEGAVGAGATFYFTLGDEVMLGDEE